jgi:hypothetical protein
MGAGGCDLYERVTAKKDAAKTEHCYFIKSPERVIAVVTRGGRYARHPLRACC